MSHGGDSGPLRRLLGPVAFAVLGLLLLALAVGVAPNFDTRLVGIGEDLWPGYAAELRQDATPPDCDVDALAAQVADCPAEDAAAPTPAGAEGDPFGGEDPFAEGGAAPADDPFAGEDPFAEAAPDPAPSDAAPADADPFAGEDPFAEAAPAAAPTAEDPFAGEDPFAEAAPAGATQNCPAQRALYEVCQTRHASYAEGQARLTGSVRTWRAFETAISDFARFDYWKHLLSLVLLLGAFATTIRSQHIALRDAESVLEHRISQGLQLLVHLAMVLSALADFQVGQDGSAEVEHPTLPLLWVAGFGLLGLVNLWHIARPPKGLDKPFSFVRLVMVVPLYVYMGVLGAFYFVVLEGHSSGQAIYLHKFVQHPSIYIGIGLYIWAGMMLSETRLSQRVVGLLTPLKLPPALLAWLLVVLAALPTAYSGASGIFVIAAGAVVFRELRKAGASPRMALSATAMSGSLGVVLRPCLVVVLVAILNKQVTTDELFSRGLQVFALTAGLYLVAMLLRNKDGFSIAPMAEAVPAIGRAGKRVLPYLLIAVAVLVFQAVVLDLRVSEHTAAFMLPVILIALVIFDTRFGGGGAQARIDDADRITPIPEQVLPALKRATNESAGHIGALLMLMAGSVGLGGVVERAELMSLVPQHLGSPVATMTILLVAMVLVGMTMDALGAVVLVSVTIAPLAYANNIAPVHFWMMVLVAFELGYLTPPVAINHLLARQVIGKEARVEEVPVEGGWWARNEHLWLPMAVMGSALIIVAYLPLLF